ncbi:DUF305 domain-containing protein [Streptomyces lunaelactis]|nr:DUF305 domain-containing protein [Streptomyces lunaelactis]NUK17191.1 DUF305 domain-containing protein [Streptomyces lunaelactis]NUK23040.1 DUF305 domain-containing protein [Streptomyces lunaelactis]NUK35796.1 DUF305 domain-containing protein [Streptomyces lunaelactis]NUK44555.1 DUF305 domain-containing protein [Streptomyces lunaelactis]
MPQEVTVLNRRRTTCVRRSVVAAAVTAAVLALGACESDSGTPAKAKGAGGPSVVAPGKPGEPARTLSADEAAKAVPDDTPNSADFSYAQMMITHHTQALQMTALAPDRVGSTQVKRLAERIAAAQKPEMGAMQGWLKINGGAQGKGGHDHSRGAMPGMATPAQLAQLRSAKGVAFDELFLKLMITHHQGALTMATEVLSEGNNVLVEEMANDVIAQQTSEINRMRSM